MPDTIIESVLTGKLDTKSLVKWLNNESIEDIPEDSILFCCNRSEFVGYFLSFLRNQTDSILQTNSNVAQILHHSTPEKILHSRRKHKRSISDPTSDDRTTDSLTIKTDRQRSHESPSKDKKRTGRRVKTKLFTEEKKECKNQSVSSDESRISIGVDRISLSSTPIKNGLKISDYPNVTSPVTPHSKSFKEFERCDTPRLSHRHSRSSEKSCLGDYIVTATKSSKKKKGKNTSNEDDSKIDLDLSNSDMFPEIGVRKASSLRSEKRRIKPTNIDKSQKSLSLNSFNADCFQQRSPLALEDNIAFKQQKLQPKETLSFEAERNILKQERHKLMEKFNILNTSPKTMAMPQIKVSQKDMTEKNQCYIKADSNKIVLRDKIDCLVEIYDVLLKNNLILSVTTEIYFLISILISKQCEDDYLNAESRLNEKNINFLLKTVHNSTYFAVKSLWNQKSVLEVILDKNSLKTLGENKKVRSFYPDLAKFLLNCYGLKCEAETQDRPKPETASNGVICFNFETDNVENFPSVLSFQNFKKQRDMFYEILRWYQDTQSSGGSRTSFRARIKTLISCGPTPANHAHLAALFVAHMLAECLPSNTQESKLSKLQRRLTSPAAAQTNSHRLPHFTHKETFYKEFLTHAENECFRVHIKDELASEITILDATHIAIEDRGQSNNPDISREYLQLVKKLGLLSKFLGYLTSLPYSQITIDTPKVLNIRGIDNYMVPKEKVLENDVGRRNYSQPSIDLKGMLINAYNQGRLCITIPWLIHYLSVLDYTSLRTKYYQNLLKILFEIYENKLKLNINTSLKKNTIIFLKSILGWLFDLPHFPQDLFYENRLKLSVASEINVDCVDLIDESVIFELCPCLKDVNVLLSTCRVSQERKEISYRHITPVSFSLNNEDRMRNKEKELQSRLEEELLKSQPSSTRRVLELVIERVTSSCVRELTASALVEARDAAREHARRRVRDTAGEDTATLLPSLRGLYAEHHARLHAHAVSSTEGVLRTRISAALSALLPTAVPPLHAFCVRSCRNRLVKWLADNWSTTAILCKDIEAEMKIFIALSEVPITQAHKSSVDVEAMLMPTPQFEAINVSPAECIINLKEQLCLLIEDVEIPDLSPLVSRCVSACSTANLFSRPPPRRAILQLTIDLCIVYVSKKPQDITDDLLNKLHTIWDTCCPDRKKSPPQELTLPERREEISPEFRNFEDDENVITPVSDEDTESERKGVQDERKVVENERKDVKSEIKVETKKVEENASCVEENNEYIEFFDRILCPRNIVLLSASECKSSEVWEAMASVLVFMLRNDYLSEDSLTEQCLAVYRQDWPQTILESLSTCMKSVSARWSRSSTGKFMLFLDFLAEYCGDMDYEPME